MENTTGILMKRLTDLVVDLENRQKLISRAISSFKKGGCSNDPFAAHLWIEKNRALIEKEIPKLSTIAGEIENVCNDAALRFEADLRDAIEAEGWMLSGQWPSYFVEFVVPIVIDEKNFRIAVGDENIQTFTIKNIIVALSAQLKNIMIEKSKLPDFLQEILIAYKRLATLQNPSVSIWAIYREIVIERQPKKFWRDASPAHFRPFREIDFKAYLTELLKNNITSISEHQMKLLPPISKEESMYIFQPYENRFCHVGRIQFT